jgi:phosphoribosyl 1,2-cyclic phosphodiesterase
MQVKFWGVRGSTPTPEAANLGHGGNTSCVEIRSGSGVLAVIDGGTGIRNLGQELMREKAERNPAIHLFLTHFHWDHIQGIPFFLPLYQADRDLTFYAAAALGPLQDRLQGQMSKPYFPVSLEVAAPRSFVEIESESLTLGDLTVRPFPMNHPQGAHGYRMESGGRTVVYASDLEHGNEKMDRVVRDFSAGADILIYDSQYTPEEYEQHRGWGHSTWLEGVRVARDAGVRQLILFHHDPWHDDGFLEEMGRRAQALFGSTAVAFEGLCADLSNPNWPALASKAGL